MGIVAMAFVCLAAYNRVQSAATAPPSEWVPALIYGKAGSKSGGIQSGFVGPLTVQKPSGQTAFSVSFPKAFTGSPRVLLTVEGDAEIITSARLVGAPTASGFRGVVSTPFFTNKQASSSVTIHWLAIGE
jgi:hypothetical protein